MDISLVTKPVLTITLEGADDIRHFRNLIFRGRQETSVDGEASLAGEILESTNGYNNQ